MTEHELSEALTEVEYQRWEAYNQRMIEHNRLKRAEEELLLQLEEEDREPTLPEGARLLELRLLRRPLIPDVWEITDFNKLERRRNWQHELSEYRWRAEVSAFAELTGNLGPILKNWWGEFNLPTMIELYEQAKASCRTVQAKQSLARRKLDYANKSLIQLEQDDSELSRRLNPDKTLGEIRRAILGEILDNLFTQFIQHIEKDLVVSLLTKANIEEPLTAQGTEHDRIGVISSPKAEFSLDLETVSTQASKKPVEVADPRDANEKLEIYLSEFSTAGCDELAEAVGLNPPAPTQRKNRVLAYSSRQGAKTKIYAIADVLADPNFDRIKPSQKIEFIKAFGRRLGYPSEKPERNAESPSYKLARENALKRLSVLVKKKE